MIIDYKGYKIDTTGLSESEISEIKKQIDETVQRSNSHAKTGGNSKDDDPKCDPDYEFDEYTANRYKKLKF